MSKLDAEIKKLLLKSLAENKGVQVRVAQDLGVSRSTVANYMKKFGIQINKKVVTLKEK